MFLHYWNVKSNNICEGTEGWRPWTFCMLMWTDTYSPPPSPLWSDHNLVLLTPCNVPLVNVTVRRWMEDSHVALQGWSRSLTGMPSVSHIKGTPIGLLRTTGTVQCHQIPACMGAVLRSLKLQQWDEKLFCCLTEHCERNEAVCVTASQNNVKDAGRLVYS